MKKFAVVLYPYYSLQEITCITATLAIWFNEKIDYIASENSCYLTEEGLPTYPTKLIQEIEITDYDCIIIPGSTNPLSGLFDDTLIEFLSKGKGGPTVFAAISSAPLLLGKAGLLEGKRYTGGLFMQQIAFFDFMEKETFTHEPVETDERLITGIGMYYQEFAEAVLRYMNYPIDESFLKPNLKYPTKEQLVFHYTEEEYREFLDEISQYQK